MFNLSTDTLVLITDTKYALCLFFTDIFIKNYSNFHAKITKTFPALICDAIFYVSKYFVLKEEKVSAIHSEAEVNFLLT